MLRGAEAVAIATLALACSKPEGAPPAGTSATKVAATPSRKAARPDESRAPVDQPAPSIAAPATARLRTSPPGDALRCCRVLAAQMPEREDRYRMAAGTCDAMRLSGQKLEQMRPTLKRILNGLELPEGCR